MGRKPRRYRECPKCEVILAAGQFEWLGRGSQGYATRRCPECGFVGITPDFSEVDPEDMPDGRVAA